MGSAPICIGRNGLSINVQAVENGFTIGYSTKNPNFVQAAQNEGYDPELHDRMLYRNMIAATNEEVLSIITELLA